MILWNAWSVVESCHSPSFKSLFTGNSSEPTAFLYAIDLKVTVNSFSVGSAPRDSMSGRWRIPTTTSGSSLSNFEFNRALKIRITAPTVQERVPNVEQSYSPRYLHRLLSTCLLHTNSGCGKREAHINWSMVTCKMAAPVTGTTLKTTGPMPADSRQ